MLNALADPASAVACRLIWWRIIAVMSEDAVRLDGSVYAPVGEYAYWRS